MRAFGESGLPSGAPVVAVGLALVVPRAPGRVSDQRLRLPGDGTVREHEEAERLPVRPARGTRRREQHGAQRAVRHRLVRVTPDGPGRGQPFEQADVVVRERCRCKVADGHAIDHASVRWQGDGVQTLDVRPLTPAIGAEIHGVDCADVDDDTIAAIRQVWLERLVVFFPDQHLDDDQQIAFAGRFGTVVEGHPIEPTLHDHPEVQPIDSDLGRTNFWHTDVTFMARPPMASMLRAVSLPDVGGDTMWSSTRAAYDALSTPLRQFCDGLVAVHHDADYAARVASGETNLWDGAKLERLDPVEHPVVRVHPETGGRSLFVNPGFTRGLRDIPGLQGAGVLRTLYQHMTQPEFVVRHRWSPGTLAFWDNRATMHFGISDYGGARRIMHRVILRGDVPVGPNPKMSG
jgi:taurine dioxygenase